MTTQKTECQTDNNHKKSREGLAAFRWAMLGSVLFVAGCSSVPDAINPAEWYKSVEQAITSDDDDEAAQEADASGSDPKPVQKSNDSDAELLARSKPVIPSGGLVADVEGRRYADDIARQGAPQNALAPDDGASLAEAPVQPAPPAQPVPGVQSTQMAAPTAPRMPINNPVDAAVANAPQSPQLVITDASQAAYQQRLDAMRARLGTQVASSTPQVQLPQGQTYNQIVGSVTETVVVTGEGVEISGTGQAMSVSPSQQASADVSAIGAGAVPTGTRVATILFPNGSAQLSSRDRQILGQVAALLKERGGRLQVVGHSSSRTRNMSPDRHKMVNMKLSVQRADRVVSELRRLGVQEASLMATARGDREPVYYEIMPSGEAGNRRAEIYLTN